MNLDKHGVWFCVQTPNMSSSIYPRRPIKLLLEALNHKSKKLIETENELENHLIHDTPNGYRKIES